MNNEFTWEDYSFHDVAELFPMMDDEALEELATDIAKEGLREPILVKDKVIIDGRNRFKACQKAGVIPVFAEYVGEEGEALVRLSMSLNLQRRHLDKSQKAVIAYNILPVLERMAKERQRQAGVQTQLVVKLRQAENIEIHQDTEESLLAGSLGSVKEEIGYIPIADAEVVTVEEPKKKSSGKSCDQVGAIVGVSGKYVADIKRIAKESPDLLEEIMSRKITLSAANHKLYEQRKAKPGYVPKVTERRIMIQIPVSADLTRSVLMDMLKVTEQSCPDDLIVYTKHGGKKAAVEVESWFKGRG